MAVVTRTVPETPDDAEPPAMRMFPPTPLPPVVEPEATTTAAAAALVEPTTREMAPADPPTASPVASVIPPLAPQYVDPELSSMLPLVPDVVVSADRTTTSPDRPAFIPVPLSTNTFPPSDPAAVEPPA